MLSKPTQTHTMLEQPVLAKVVAAFILFAVTLLFTLLPTRFKETEEKTLKTVSCFCGGLFLGLSFLHLVPDVLRAFKNVESLNSLQQTYPMAEFTICVGMILVMTAEKLAEVLQQRKAEKKCDASKDCCKETCRRTIGERTPLLQSLQSSYSASDDTVDFIEENERQDGSTKDYEIIEAQKPDILLRDEDFSPKVCPKSLKNAKLSELSTKSTVETRKQRMRTVCLVIALMVHSLFEGLTVGLQDSVMGLITLVALLAFHKCIIGFSLGVNIVKAKVPFRFYLQQAALFSVASPIGAIVGLILLSSKFHLFNQEAVSLLTALSTGTFLFITFFELLAKDLAGNGVRDIINFASFLMGFAVFAALSTIKKLQA